MSGLPGVRVGCREHRGLIQVFGGSLHDDDAPAVDIGVDEEIPALHVLLDELLVLGGIPAADNKDAIRRHEPPEPVVPPLLLEDETLLSPGFLRDRPLHGSMGAGLLLLELLDLVVVAADVLLDRLMDEHLHPLPGDLDLHRRLRRVNGADHLCGRVIAVRLQDRLDLLPRPDPARRIERLYNPGDNLVVLVERLHDPLVALDLLLKTAYGIRLALADHLLPGEPGLCARSLPLLTLDLRVEGIQGLAEGLEPLADLIPGEHHRPAPGVRDHGIPALPDIGHQPVKSIPDGLRIHVRGRGALIDTRHTADLLSVHAAEHAPDGKCPDDIAVRAGEQPPELIRRERRAVCPRKRIGRARNHIPVLEPVVPEGFYDRVVLVAEDGVSFIEDLEYEVVGRISLPDIDTHGPLDPELPDAEHPAAIEVLSEQHRKPRGMLWGPWKLGGEVGAPSRLHEEEVLCPVLSV